MAKVSGYVNADLLIKVQGADEPTSIGRIAIPLKIVNDRDFSLAVDHGEVKRLVEQVYQNPEKEQSNG